VSEWVRSGPIDERFQGVAPAASFTIGTVNVAEDEAWEIVSASSINLTANRGYLYLYYYYGGVKMGTAYAWNMDSGQPGSFWNPVCFPGEYEIRAILSGVSAGDEIRVVLTGWRWKEKVE